jgi:hypothetical protein
MQETPFQRPKTHFPPGEHALNRESHIIKLLSPSKKNPGHATEVWSLQYMLLSGYNFA